MSQRSVIWHLFQKHIFICWPIHPFKNFSSLHSLCMKFSDLKFWVQKNTFATKKSLKFCFVQRFRPLEQDSSKCSVLIDVAFVIKQVLCTQPDPEKIRVKMVICKPKSSMLWPWYPRSLFEGLIRKATWNLTIEDFDLHFDEHFESHLSGSAALSPPHHNCCKSAPVTVCRPLLQVRARICSGRSAVTEIRHPRWLRARERGAARA